MLFAKDVPDHKRVRFHPRILGSAAPVFPGYEIDVTDAVPDNEKPDAVWHRERARNMIRAHPEIKELFGNTPSTAIWCFLFAGLQIGLAVALSIAPWWVMLLVAYVVGSWIDMNLFQLSHECNHNLVFKKTSWNRWLFTFCSLPMGMSGHHTWWIEHHVHHNDLGARKDFITRRRTFFLLTRQDVYLWVIRRGVPYKLCCLLFSPMFLPYALIMLVTQAIRSLLGLVVYVFGALTRGKLDPEPLALSILADEHLISGYEQYGTKRWAVVYPLLSLGLGALLCYFVGWQAVVYLLLSQLFATGFLHPAMFGLILSNSHFHGHKTYQPSSSYYGWLNWITFNFGLHTEHHDIMGIPWSRLRRLREIAPEFYDDLIITPSYTRLAFTFALADRGTMEQCFDNQDIRNRDLLEEKGVRSRI